jgi:DNA polymerase
MSVLRLDLESRSTVDLKKLGVHEYAAHPTTDVWLAAYSFDDEEPTLWFPGQPCPFDIVDHVTAGGEIRIWNAQFERVMWREILTPRYGWPTPKLEQFSCTMAKAYALALPGDLDGASQALGLSTTKDMTGKRLMLQMSRPRKRNEDGTFVWWDDAERVKRLGDYCKQDVIVEREIDKCLVDLRPLEKRVYWLDQRMNDLGVYIDRSLCKAALKVVEASTLRLNAEMAEITGGAVRACTAAARLIAWLATVGVETDSVDKASIIKLLACELPPQARRAIELRKEAAKSSTAKIAVLLARSERDGWMRGNIQYHGATTGRDAARGAQLQNLPRGTSKDVNGVIEAILTGDADWVDLLYGDPMSRVSDAIRGMIAAPPGLDICCADFASIEARVLAWLAGQDDVLDVFRSGSDIYCHEAGPIFGYPVNKDDHPNERQVGKCAVLALGFLGGIGAFGSMAKIYGVDLTPIFPSLRATDEELEKAEWSYDMYAKRVPEPLGQDAGYAADIIKQRWRGKNRRIVSFGRQLEEAAILAVQNPGETFPVGPYIQFKVRSRWLFCQLPSGRCLAYTYPHIKERKTPWGSLASGVSCFAVDGITRKWSEHQLHAGVFSENVTQAVARDLMKESALRLDTAGYKIALPIHDELMSYAPASLGQIVWNEKKKQREDKLFNRLMAAAPDWAEGCPVGVEGWRGTRYKKG